jgi:hypothetical protein
VPSLGTLWAVLTSVAFRTKGGQQLQYRLHYSQRPSKAGEQNSGSARKGKEMSHSNSNKNNETKIAQFLKNTATLRSAIAKQFHAMEAVEVHYQSAIAQLGNSLLQLKAACKGLVKFQDAITNPDYGVNIPFRSAKRYMSLVRRMNGLSATTVARIITAGYDPASQRVLEVVEKLGSAKVNQMSASTLSEKLRKSSTRTKSRTATTILNEAMAKFVVKKVKADWTVPEIRTEIQEAINKNLNPSIVKDIQSEEETQTKAA